MSNQELTQEYLKSILDYDAVTGIFTHKRSIPQCHIKPGDIAGYDHKGYIRISVNGKGYRAHRLAWLYVYGVLPENGIDHKNGIKTDNSIDNLREANQSENNQNKAMHRNNKSGYMGVSFYKVTKKWKAQITINYKVIGLGYYDTPEEASDAYKSAKLKLHSFNPIQRK